MGFKITLSTDHGLLLNHCLGDHVVPGVRSRTFACKACTPASLELCSHSLSFPQLLLLWWLGWHTCMCLLIYLDSVLTGALWYSQMPNRVTYTHLVVVGDHTLMQYWGSQTEELPELCLAPVGGTRIWTYGPESCIVGTCRHRAISWAPCPYNPFYWLHFKWAKGY